MSVLGPKSDITVSGEMSGFLQRGGSWPIVMLARNRPAMLSKTLRSLLAVAGVSRDDITVSVHGSDSGVLNVLKSFEIDYFQNTDLGSSYGAPWEKGARRIAQHYKYTLSTMFKRMADPAHPRTKQAPALVVVEDDLLFAHDFMDYLLAAAPVLDVDPTVWCISAWNDNGFKGLVKNSLRLKRTGFFPGLGWLISRKVWEGELEEGWPDQHWDHWLRDAKRHKGRDCITPEVPRTYHNGIKGTFMDLSTHNKYFANIALNDGQSFGSSFFNWQHQLHGTTAGGVSGVPVQLPETVALAVKGHYVARLDALLDAGQYVGGAHDIDAGLGEGGATKGEAVLGGSVGSGSGSQGAVAQVGQAGEDGVLKGQHPELPSLVVCFRFNIKSDNNGFKPLASYLGIWHEPQRTAFHGIHELYVQGRHIILVNTDNSVGNDLARHCEGHPTLSPGDFRGVAAPRARPEVRVAFEVVAGEQKGDSCIAVCEAKSMDCTDDAGAVYAINTCTALLKVFPCSREKCKRSEGSDQPVFEPAANTCLWSGGSFPFKCEASHHATRRLCPCTARQNR